MTVGFANVEEADACCQYMSGRIWHGRVIQCQNYDGKTSSFFSEHIQSEFFVGSTKYDVIASKNIFGLDYSGWKHTMMLLYKDS